ncbi:MAG: MarR family transcriptional regulator [Candidatus Moranbacteria bacterium]|nr:MarR family transcriptional regulator [Candidatus Moranbacteria bacterium]
MQFCATQTAPLQGGECLNSDEISLGKWIAVLHKYRRSYVNKKLEPYGFSGGQFTILLALSRHDGANQEEIAERLKIDKTMAAKAIKKLEGNGYILKKRDQSDGRAYNVFLTQKGRDLVPFIKKTALDWENGVISGLTEEECQTVERLLAKMANNAFDFCEKE